MKKTIRTILLAVFTAAFLFSGVMVVKELHDRRVSASYLHGMQDVYAPAIRTDVPAVLPGKTTDAGSGADGDAAESAEAAPADTSNPEIARLTEDYPDAVGWLTAEGAGVSHPFALGETNRTYLRTALDGSYVRSGTLFLDCRCSRDMRDSLTVLYGHNLNNGTMFSELARYLDSAYIRSWPDIWVSLPDRTEHYTVWAAMVADAASDRLFENAGAQGDIGDIVDYVRTNAGYIGPDLTVTGGDRLLVLSTCNPSFFTARTVVICVADRTA